MMENIKENAGTIAIGLAATAIAGLLLYKTINASKGEGEDGKSDEPEVIPDRFFFIDPALSIEDKEAAITKWAKEQVDSLLQSVGDSDTLRAPKGILVKEDFLILVNIVENRIKVFFDEEKTNNAQKRLPVLQENGIESGDYLDKVITDVCGLLECEDMPKNEVLDLVKVRSKCLEASFEEHVGDENSINMQFVKNHMEILNFYPMKNEKSYSKEEALELYTSILSKVMDRFEKPDTPGKFTSVLSFIKCFDQVCVDFAKVDKELSEADFRALVHDSDLLEETQVDELFVRVAKEINKHLESGNEVQLALEKQLTVDF